MKILIDNGHGAETQGKCSPDGRLREWEFNRRLAYAVHSAMSDAGIDAAILVPESTDVALSERCGRANAAAAKEECLLLSLHVNAAGSGGWHNAHGWSAFVAPQACAASRRLAAMLTAEAAKRGLSGNRATPPQGYWTASLAIVRDVRCPAVLTENMFMDNRADLKFLLSRHGLQTLAELHTAAVLHYLGTL